jgi:hypothetical protein
MPKLVILLLVWFFWAAGKDLDALVRHSVYTDYYIFTAAGVPWIFFFMVIGVFLLNTATIYFLFRPQRAGLWVLFNALIAGAVQNIVTIAFALPNLASVREAYARSRELRGLPVREDALNMIFTPSTMATTVVLMLCLYALIAFIAHRKRQYFLGNGNVAVQPPVAGDAP